ncbi:MAG: CPBP family intramembrane metalloprotease [Bacteroidetes bacterium]|nr:CPBP family intramembrane metalloprotease [Bacteroidota bacterium]
MPPLAEKPGNATDLDPSAAAAEWQRAVTPGPLLHPVAFAFLLVLVTFVAYQVMGGIITYLLFGLETSQNIAGVRAVTVVSQLLFLMLPAVVLLRFQGWKVREVLRLHMPKLLPLLVVVVSVIALQFVVQAWVELQQYVMREYLLPDFLLPVLDTFEKLLEELYGQLLAMHTPIEALTVWVVVALTPALCEEVLFRGAVQFSFEKKLRLRWAFLLSGAIFSFFHLNPITFIPLALLGVYFSVITWRGNSLGYAIAAHATNNTIAVVAMYFFKSENLLPVDAASDAPSLAVYALSGTLALAVFAACVAYFWMLTRPQPAAPAATH